MGGPRRSCSRVDYDAATDRACDGQQHSIAVCSMLACLHVRIMRLPEPFPKRLEPRIQFRVAGTDRARVCVLLRACDEALPHWVFADIMAERHQRSLLPFFFAKHVVEGLPLPRGGPQQRRGVSPEEGDRPPLIGIVACSEQHEMDVIRHQAISRAIQMIPDRRVQEDLAKRCVECRAEPARAASGNGHHPVDKRQPAVRVFVEPGKVRV